MLLARIAAILCVVSLAVAAGPAPGGQDGDAWPVKGKLIGKTKKSGEVGKSKDVSGIACTTDTGFPRDCLVIDDNLQVAQFVTVKDGKLVAGDTIRLMRDKFEGESLELDGEGVAFSKGFYYVIGSHGHPRDSDGKLDPVRDAELIRARIDAASQIIRFRAKHGADAKVERTSNLKKMIAAEPAFEGFRDQRLEKNGLTIEGIAVKDGTLFAGFRGPVLDGNKKAVVMSAPLDTFFDNAAAQPSLFRLPLGEGRGVRDLASYEGGILILAGPVGSVPGVYAIYWWDGASENVRLLSELTQFDPKRKPEGLLPLDKKETKLRVLIIFDSDEEGTPTPVEVPAP
jgi:uncharacterized protein DUF3616